MVSLLQVGKLKRNVRRFDRIVRVLTKYGLADWMKEGTPKFISGRFVGPEGQDLRLLPWEVRVRMALTELGTTFIKLGQMLSTRADIVGPALANELAALQADTPADSPAAVRETVEREFGRSIEELFVQFNETALASASVGQVHLATLEDGSDVVVKVQHQGIETVVNNDLDLVMSLAQLAESRSEALRRYRPVATAAEFRRSLLRELDFTIELNNIEQMSRNFADDPDVHIPQAYPERSTRYVLTMERLRGYSVASSERLLADGVDTQELARRFTRVFLDMLFRDRFFHADPHPGNIFVLDDGRIGLLDLGKVGRLDEETQDAFEGIIGAFLAQDGEQLTMELIRLCEVPSDLDQRAYRSDINDFIAEFRNTGGGLDIGAVVNTMFSIIRKHHLVVPPRVNLLLIVIVQVEGTARQLDPSFNLAQALQAYQARTLWRRYTPERMLRRSYRYYRDINRLIAELPRSLTVILEHIRDGETIVQVQQRGIDRPANRLVFGFVTAALLFGSALLWALAAPPTLWGVSIFGVLGVLSAFWLAFWLYLGIRRSGGL